MKEQLIKLAKEIGFLSRNKLVKVNDDYYYLWLCELQKWLREKHKLHVSVVRFDDGWHYQIYEFSHGNKFVIGGSSEIPNYNKEFEKGLFEALKLIK